MGEGVCTSPMKGIVMADGLNRVMLLGSLGSDPELRCTQGGVSVLNMRIATNESYLDKDKVRRERTDWHTVVIFGRRAEALSKILTKGSSVFIEGSLRTSSYDDRDGNKRYKTEIHATNVLLTGKSGGGGHAHDDDGDHGGGDRERPAGRSGGGYGAPRGGSRGAPRGGGRPAAPRQQSMPTGDYEPAPTNPDAEPEQVDGYGEKDIPF